jgi:hypothetical protein
MLALFLFFGNLLWNVVDFSLRYKLQSLSIKMLLKYCEIVLGIVCVSFGCEFCFELLFNIILDYVLVLKLSLVLYLCFALVVAWYCLDDISKNSANSYFCETLAPLLHRWKNESRASLENFFKDLKILGYCLWYLYTGYSQSSVLSVIKLNRAGISVSLPGTINYVDNLKQLESVNNLFLFYQKNSSPLNLNHLTSIGIFLVFEQVFKSCMFSSEFEHFSPQEKDTYTTAYYTLFNNVEHHMG